MSTRTFAAILLDFDGTTVDSEPKHCAAHQRFLRTQGIDITEAEIYGNVGKSDRLFYLDLMAKFGKQGDVFQWMEAKTEELLKISASLTSIPCVRKKRWCAAQCFGSESTVVPSKSRRMAAKVRVDIAAEPMRQRTIRKHGGLGSTDAKIAKRKRPKN